MAIYSFHAQVISRRDGRSSVASAAYRSGGALYDERTGETYDYRHKEGVAHTEILAPQGAPEWVRDRSVLWNAVERVELRKDAQLARELMIALPVELTKDQQIELLRDYAKRSFVADGMIVDFALHLDNPENPHAHLMLTTREIAAEGFGQKVRSWNAKAELMRWREGWAQRANEHLVRAQVDVRIDHRSFAEQGIELTPGRKIGLSIERQAAPDLSDNLVRRVAEARAIAASNGAQILADPTVALRAMSYAQATFTQRDIARYLNGKSDGAEQFQAALLKVKASPELVRLGQDESGRARFTTREMLGIEHEMLERAVRMAGLEAHRVSERHQAQVLADGALSAQQREAFKQVTGGQDLSVLVGVAGSGKSTLLERARRAWEAAGWQVKGAALAGVAAESLESASGISSRTLASWTMSWENGRDRLGRSDVLVIDEAGLIGTRQLGRVLEEVEAAQAKVVLIGDPEQLQAIEAGAAFRGIAAEVGPVVELQPVRRQKAAWQQEATRDLASGRTAAALEAYEAVGLVQAAPTREAARGALLRAWQQSGQEQGSGSRLMLAYRRDEVRELNEAARAMRQEAGELGEGEVIQTERGPRAFAASDRICFLKNERSLGVKNGSLGTVEKIRSGTLQVRLDGLGERRIVVESRDYAHLDHGYAATVHKSQGTTVDHTFVLATPHFDRHATYVALSRHRDSAAVFYGEADFANQPGRSAAQGFCEVLARARPKELAHDYLDSGDVREGQAQAVGLERERLARLHSREMLNSRELRELIARINPPSVERLVELDPAVAGIRQEAERHQSTAQQALRAGSQAAHESHLWRQAHGMQAKLHDLGVVKAQYLVVREAAGLEAQRMRGESLNASGQALKQLEQARGEASARITQETAPARAQVAELRERMTAAYERERLVAQFKELAQGRAAGKAAYQDSSPGWQATTVKLREAIDAYNREPSRAQEEILERFARTSVLVETLGEDLQRRRELVREQWHDHDQGLGL